MPETALLVGSLVFGSGGILSAVLMWLRERRQAPLEELAAQVANAASVANTATGLLNVVQARLTEQDGKIVALEAKLNTQADVIVLQERRITKLSLVISDWVTWYRKKAAGWDYYRQQDTMPDPPTERWPDAAES